MTLEELKQAADTMGYKLTKKEQYIRLSKHCGVYPHEWFSCGTHEPASYYLQCPVCGLRCENVESLKQARIVWNNMFYV